MNSHINIPAHLPFASSLARLILRDATDQLPDLQNIHIFLPNALSARQLRRALVEQSQKGILGPNISSMSQWINNHVPLPDYKLTQINQSGRQLILFEALKQHRNLFNENNLWQICNSLLEFFDELSQNSFDLEKYSADKWQAQLQNAYGIQPDNNRDINHLFYEARIVHTLWQAWQQQTSAMNLHDASTIYHLRLQQDTTDLMQQTKLYVVGFEQLMKAEQQWCTKFESGNQVTYISQSNEPADNPAGRFFRQALDTSQTIQKIADPVQQAASLDISDKLSLYAAPSAETEARAIHMQARCWLAENKNSIAIVSENRKIMRRVRALMERSGIVVEDTAGWSIATTSAATCLERWLQCIEQDFAWQPLLDLLKSPFFCASEHRTEHLKNIFRLEQDVIVYERITAGISRYKKALQQRHARIPHWHNETGSTLQALLERLENASSVIHEIYTSRKSLNVQALINAILNSLDALGIITQLEQDAAGIIVLQEIRKLEISAQHIPCAMTWQDFRTWLGAALEQQPFTPKNKPSTVHLLNLKQAEYCQFDAVILASANADSLPGRPSQTPFFNQSVRRALNLKTWTEVKAENFLRFRSLLQSASHTLISYQAEQDGEWLQPSPWLQSIDDYARLAIGINLRNTTLDKLLQIEETGIDSSAVAMPSQTRPSPSISPALAPGRWSVSSYQRIVDCPYKFFAADVLALKAEDQITRELLRSEYGEKVHETLRAFFEQRPHLPPPFKHPVTEHNKQLAVDHLMAIAQQIFARDMENNVQHKGWLQQWAATAETFITWLIERQQNWQFDQAEVAGQHDIDEITQLYGRLDLVEKNSNGLAIIDYKSGTSPRQQAVDDGENVQLTAYALLMKNVSEVGFLKLDKKKTDFSASARDTELQNLAAMNLTRLRELALSIRSGQGLTAWGDSQTCRFCDMAGLCRKQIWQSVSS
jgi:ATP-dependent helicase/nuclease subunit B